MDEVAVSYLPFVGAAQDFDKGTFPPRVSKTVERARIYDLPGALKSQDAMSILRLYIADLEFIIYPDCHANEAGETLTNVSYYTNEEEPDARCNYADGVFRTTVSIGEARHLASLAAEIYRLISPILFKDETVAWRSTGKEIMDLMRLNDTIDHSTFAALISEYPRFFNDDRNEFENEYFIFADMLRFLWCHEWGHAVAGHARLMREKFRIAGLSETGRTEDRVPHFVIRHAMEFEADSLAIQIMLRQIFRGRDMPGCVLAFQGTLVDRLFWTVLAFSIVTTHWSEVERSLGIADRYHPPADFRYLNAWDTILAELMRANMPNEQASVNARAAHVIFELSDVCPAL